MRLRTVSGFGLLQVMIGTVVLGIFAMVFVRKAQNRADISLLTELITYRDQVLDYYSAVVQSRTAWQCTRKCNTGSLPTTPPGTGFKLYDGDGNCQTTCPASTKPTLRLPDTGWRFSMSLTLNNKFAPFGLPYNGTLPTGNNGDTHPFLVKATWQKVSTTTNSVKVTIKVEFDPTKVWRKKYTTMDIGDRERVFYMNRTPYKNCADGLAARFGSKQFYDSEVAGVHRYAGDTAVVAIDATTGLVECWNSPLVIPPCYEPSEFPFSSPTSSPIDSPNHLDFVADPRGCSSIDKGLCPRINLTGTTGITHFDRFTGISHCSREHILMVEGSDGKSGVNCDAQGHGGLVGISPTGEFICSNPHTLNAIAGNGGTGVYHNEDNEYSHGIRGWSASGHIERANYPNVTGEHGRISSQTGDGYYWTGDRGDNSTVSGTSILCHNCCTYPKLRSKNWPAGCCQEKDEDCNISANANPTCIVCDAAVATCNACRAEYQRSCVVPCRTCEDDMRNCMYTCTTCRTDKADCEKGCDDCEGNCRSNCNSCESTNCSGLSGDRRTECLSNHCNSDCNTCLPACADSEDCKKVQRGDCGDCNDECDDEDDCNNDWDSDDCDVKCSEDGESCIGSSRMSFGCQNYTSPNRPCHDATVIFPACGVNDNTAGSCKKCRKDKNACQRKHDALINVRDTSITNNSSTHCRDVVSP